MKRGQSLFEVVVAVAAIGLVLTAVVGIAVVSIRNSNFSKNRSRATRLGQDAVEWMRGERNEDEEVFSGKVGNTYCMIVPGWNNPGACTSTDAPIEGIFTRQVALSGSADEVVVDVSVSWTDAQGMHSSKISTIFAQ